MTQPTTNSNYTSSEIQAVVQKLVLSAIRRPYDTLGVRRTDITFSDVQQAAASVFILFPNSPFYVLQLGMKRVQDQVASEAAILDALLAAVSVVGRPVLPVNDVSPLFNAQAALQNLGVVAAKRSSTFGDITKTPSYQQFAVNTQAFLSGPGGQAVKQNGTIVQTPQQAVAAIPGLVNQLEQAHTALVATVLGLTNGIDDYNALNLPSVVIQSILSNAAALVGADAAALNALTPDQRLASVRAVVLNLLASKAVVDKFGTFSGPSDFWALDGAGAPYSDANHLAVPAVVRADKSGGYAVVPGVSDTLHLTVDGGAPVDLVLNGSLVASISGNADDSTFVINTSNDAFKVKVAGVTYVATLGHSSAATPATLTGSADLSVGGLYGGGGSLDGKTFSVLCDGVGVKSVTLAAPADETSLLTQLNNALGFPPSPVVCTIVANHLVLTSTTSGTGSQLYIEGGTGAFLLGFVATESATGANGGTRTADQVAADIAAAMPAGVVAEAFYSPLKLHNLMDIPAGVDQVWPLTLPGAADLIALGVNTNDTANVLSGANAGTRYPITAVTSSSITVSGATVLQPGATVEIGPVHRRVRVRCSDPATQIPAETLLTVFGDDTPSTNCLLTLGVVNGQFSQCQQTTADLVATDINSKTGLLTAATAVVTTVGPLATAHTDALVSNPNLVTFMRAAAAGTTAFALTTLTYTVTSLTTAGQVSTGDTLVLRDGASPGQYYTVTTVNGSSASGHTLAVGDVVVATGSLTGTPDVAVHAELGPTLNAQKYQVVVVASGPNAGTYFASGMGASPIDVLLARSLPQVRSLASPTSGPIMMTASFGDMYLTLASKNMTTSSSLVISGDAASLFFFSTPHTQLGTSPWFHLPSTPVGLQVGDILEYYPTDYNTPSFSYPILAISSTLNVIQVGVDPVSGSFPPDGAVWQFSPQPVPFARLHFGIKNDFGLVHDELTAWLARKENQALYLTNLNAQVNPILVNSNPTAVQVGDALQAIEELYQYLTIAEATNKAVDPAFSLQAILQTFTIEPVPQVDTLIQSYVQKGCDRAVDTLLQGQFSSFFGMTADQASYSGAMQAATRAVAMNDLPVRKVSRPEVQTSQLIGQTESPDMEYTANLAAETIPGMQVDPPTSFGEPSNYGRTTGSQGSGNQ